MAQKAFIFTRDSADVSTITSSELTATGVFTSVDTPTFPLRTGSISKYEGKKILVVGYGGRFE